MTAYFTQGQAVDDPAALRRIASEAGLDAQAVDDVLASDRFAEDVRADVAQAQAFGANGVPFTVVDRRYALSGAQPVELFEQALRRAWEERQAQPA
jgi:predicted DsbA family dithiol-disulfide isomerase